MGVAHRHGQRLVAEPHLHAANVDAAAHETRGAGVAQNVRHQILVMGKPDRLARLQPGLAELLPITPWKGPIERPPEPAIASCARSVSGTERLRPDLVIQKVAMRP